MRSLLSGPWALAIVIASVPAISPAQEMTDAQFLELAKDPEIIQRGDKLFQTNCIVCHLATLPEKDPMNLRDAVSLHGNKPADLQAIIAKGVPGTRMMGFGALLKPKQIQTITAYLMSLQTKSSNTPTSTP